MWFSKGKRRKLSLSETGGIVTKEFSLAYFSRRIWESGEVLQIANCVTTKPRRLKNKEHAWAFWSNSEVFSFFQESKHRNARSRWDVEKWCAVVRFFDDREVEPFVGVKNFDAVLVARDRSKINCNGIHGTAVLGWPEFRKSNNSKSLAGCRLQYYACTSNAIIPTSWIVPWTFTLMLWPKPCLRAAQFPSPTCLPPSFSLENVFLHDCSAHSNSHGC